MYNSKGLDKSNGNGKRIGIFFFYDAEGVVDKYVEYMLADIVKSVDKLVIVSNGDLNVKSKEKLGKFTQSNGRGNGELIIRENKGFDVWAYKEGMEACGWEELDNCYELILFNFTIMGPVYPFAEMFSSMDKKDVDFWGINVHYGVPNNHFGCSPYKYIPKHLQSHFIVFRNNLIRSELFHDYWDNMPMINSYDESVGRHESFLTKYFADHGFKWEAYVNVDDLSELSDYPLMDLPVEVVSEKRCPIFKRKSFFVDTRHFMLRGSAPVQGRMLYEFLRDHTDYDVAMIDENMRRSCNQADYAGSLDLIKAVNCETPSNKHSIAVLIGQRANWTNEKINTLKSSFPKETAFFAAEKNGKQEWKNLYTGCDADFQSFDYVCVINPYENIGLYSFGQYVSCEYIAKHLFDNEMNVNGVIALLEKNENAAVISALRPVGMYAYILSNWQYICRRWFQNVNACFNSTKLPVGGGCGIFWVKSSAFTEELSKTLKLDLDGSGYKGEYLDLVLSITAQMLGKDGISLCENQQLIDNQNAAEQIISTSMNRIAELETTIRSLVPRTKIRVQFALQFKYKFPRLYKALVKTKRFFFGPRHVPVNMAEPWENTGIDIGKFIDFERLR